MDTAKPCPSCRAPDPQLCFPLRSHRTGEVIGWSWVRSPDDPNRERCDDKYHDLTDHPLDRAADCECYHTCMENPKTGCSLSGRWHVHAGEPCPVHPDAPGDR